MPGGEETSEGRHLGKYRTKAWSISLVDGISPLVPSQPWFQLTSGSLPDGWERSETVNGIPYYRK